MAYFIWLGLIILGLIIPKKKLIKHLQLAYIFIAIAFCTWAPDLAANEFMYYNIRSGLYSLYEPIYVGLMRLTSSLGLDFTGFRCVVCALSILFINKGLSANISRTNSVLSIMLIYPVLGFASGLRSLLPYAITIFAATNYLKKSEDGSTRKYMFWIVIATLCHYSFVLFLILPLIKLNFNIKKFLTIILMEIIFMFLLSKGILYNIISKFIHHNKVLSWFNMSNYNHPSILVDLIITIMVCASVYAIYQWSREVFYYGNKEKLAFIKYNRNLSLMMLTILILMYLNVTFERYLGVWISLEVILLADSFRERDVRRWIIPVIALLFNLGFYYVIHGNIFFPIIGNNSLFS